jgi:hypothetical protein
VPVLADCGGEALHLTFPAGRQKPALATRGRLGELWGMFTSKAERHAFKDGASQNE